MLIAEVNNIPDDLALSPLAREELTRLTPVERKIYLRRSKRTWILLDDDEIVAALGVHKPTQLSTPELWMLMCDGFKRNLRANLRVLRFRVGDLFALYPHLMLRVDAKHLDAQHFVRFFGFTEYYRTQTDDREFIYYEAKKWL